MWRWVGVGCPRLGALPRGTASWCEGRRGAKGGGARRRGVKDRSARGDYHPTTTHLPLSKVTLFFAQLSAYTSPYPPCPRSPLLFLLEDSPRHLGIQLSASNTPNLADLTANTAPTGTATTAVSGIGQPPSRVPMRRPSTGGCAEKSRSTSLPHEDHASTRVEGVRDKIIWLGGQGVNRVRGRVARKRTTRKPGVPYTAPRTVRTRSTSSAYTSVACGVHATRASAVL